MDTSKKNGLAALSAALLGAILLLLSIGYVIEQEKRKFLLKEIEDIQAFSENPADRMKE